MRLGHFTPQRQNAPIVIGVVANELFLATINAAPDRG